MSQQTFADGESLASVRAKLNNNAQDAETRLIPLEVKATQAVTDVVTSNAVNTVTTEAADGRVALYILTNTGARTVTLPATADVGARIQIQNGADPGGAITITVDGGGPITFGTQATLTLTGESAEFVFDGTKWWAR